MKILIFCGGSGTRMWPMSRSSAPKQFQPLIGNKSIFQQTVERILKVPGLSSQDIYVSTQKEYKQKVLNEFPGIKEENLIIEPEKRDTMACVGYAVSVIKQKRGDDIVISMWSDLYVRNDEEFIRAVEAGIHLVEQKNLIVNIDAKPSSPNVSLGYMEIGKFLQNIDGFSVYELVRQVEKPNLEKAKEYVRSVKYLWHTGYMVFRIDNLLSLYEKYAKDSFEIYRQMLNAGVSTEKSFELYKNIPKTSIDIGIFEKVERGGIVEIPADLGFSDVGLWGVLKDELAENGRALVVKGENYDLGSIDCLVYQLNEGKIIATIGLENLIIVDTKDALLVCSKFKSQEVKKIVERLKEEGKDRYL